MQMMFIRSALLVLLAVVPAAALNLRKVRNDPCPFGYGDNCASEKPLTAATRAQVAGILEGVLGNLQSHKALMQSSGKVHKGPAESVPAPVGHALKSLLSTVRTHQAAAADALQDMLAREDPDVACTYFGACGKIDRPISAKTKAEVAGILEGVLSNLSSHKASLVALKVRNDPCPFGYGDNCASEKPLTAATRAQVAGILEGVLGNLQSHKALMQSSGKVHKGPAETLPAPVGHALKSLLSTMRTHQAAAADALQDMLARDHPDSFICWTCKGGDQPITAQTKAEVAGILEGVLSNLSSHK